MCVKTLFVMGFLSTSSEFEITVNHSQAEAFDKFLAYVKQSRNLILSQSSRCEMISYTRKTSLFSMPIDFVIEFKEDGINKTKLMVQTSSGTVDWGKAKGMVNDIVKEIY